MSAGIWVVIEHRDGEIRKVSLEALGVARSIANSKGAEVVALILGSEPAGLYGRVSAGGADKLIAVADAALANYTTDAYTHVITELVKARKPAALLIGATSTGRDLAGRLAARLDTGLLADVIGLTTEGDAFVAQRPMNAGKVIATVEATPGDAPVVISIRPKAFELPSTDTSRTAMVDTVPYTAPASGVRTAVQGLNKAAGGKVELTEADVIVSGGRGIKGPEHFNILEDLADVLGAAVGASRAVVDAGWRDHSAQVGQTGKVVTPKLYIACGISGAIQHLVGMANSKYVIAINKDPEAPIFKRADIGIAGDLFEIVPALTKELRKSA